MGVLVFLGLLGGEKQSQFISVQRSAFCGQRKDEEKEFEKTKSIFLFSVQRTAYCDKN